ncbi:uncharacterized protein A4U43_C08F6970 [Asparagus officinalis]|nr:uncharacterized protein A4U43_C08F6970 [Asparagus officinalis]
MKFKKGSKVEVLDKREVPSGSWLCAEVISGDGDYYSIKYDCYSDNAGVTVERVPRGAIRPRPPSVLYTRCWVPGDIVEVFEKNSWKLAEVLKVVKGKYFFVRLIGYSKKLRAHMSELRPRQVWEDNSWIVIQKEGGNDRFMNSKSKAGDDSNRMPQSGIEGKSSGQNDQFSHKYEGGLDECGWVTLEGKKRRQCLYLPQTDTCTGARKKLRFVEKMERSQRALGTLSSHLLEKHELSHGEQTILLWLMSYVFWTNQVKTSF